MANPVTPKPPTDLLSTFESWAAGRTGFTINELIDIFLRNYNLTPEETKEFTEEAIKQWEAAQAAKRAKEKEEEEEKRAQEEKRKEDEERKRKEEEEKKKEEEVGIKKEVTPTRPRTEILAAFLQYAKGKTGFQLGQLIGMFSWMYKLSNEEYRALNEDVNKLIAEQEEQRRKEEEEKERKEEEEKKKEEEKRKKEEEQKKNKEEEEKKKKKEVQKTLVIERTPYPKWWKDALARNITIDDAGTHIVMPPTPGYRTYISTIVLTVDGETTITFKLGVFGLSGPMYFGGEGQPMGMVIAMGDSPMPLGMGGLEIITDGAGVHGGGFISYYYEKE